MIEQAPRGMLLVGEEAAIDQSRLEDRDLQAAKSWRSESGIDGSRKM